jgi:hypothetical protein
MADYDSAPKVFNPTRQFLLTRAATLARMLVDKFPGAPSDAIRATTLSSVKEEYADLTTAMKAFEGLWQHHCEANGFPEDHSPTYWD